MSRRRAGSAIVSENRMGIAPQARRALVVGWALSVAVLGGCRDRGRLPSWAEFLDTGDRVSGALITFAGSVETPRSSAGVAGASRDAARSFGAACVGWLPDAAQHTLRLQEETALRVRAEGAHDDDLVLVLTGKNGTLCNDDYDGVAPGMQVRLEPGDYSVFVGVRERSGSATGAVRYSLWVEPPIEDSAFQGLSPQMLAEELERLDRRDPPLSGTTLQELESQIDAQKSRMGLP